MANQTELLNVSDEMKLNDNVQMKDVKEQEENMYSSSSDTTEELCSSSTTDTCGDGGWTTTQKYVEILEFTHFTEFWTFNEVGVNHKEKVQVRKLEVSVVLDLDT